LVKADIKRILGDEKTPEDAATAKAPTITSTTTTTADVFQD
jgi:hypothetical protein